MSFGSILSGYLDNRFFFSTVSLHFFDKKGAAWLASSFLTKGRSAWLAFIFLDKRKTGWPPSFLTKGRWRPEGDIATL